MRQHVTVVPIDGIVIVDGMPLSFAFDAPANLHALQWHDGAGEMEWTDDLNHPLTEQDYDADVAPFVALWEAEKARLDEEASRPPTLEEMKSDAMARVDVATSASIMGGFDCEATSPDADTPETLHFSYDSFDQQNFSDTAIAMQLGQAATEGVPTSTPWNAYRNWTAANGGELVVLQLTAKTFLPLYAAALRHKASNMAEGGIRKKQVEAVTGETGGVEAVRALLAEWGL